MTATFFTSIIGLRIDRVGGVAEMEVGDAQRFLWVAEQENHLVTTTKPDIQALLNLSTCTQQQAKIAYNGARSGIVLANIKPRVIYMTLGTRKASVPATWCLDSDHGLNGKKKTRMEDYHLDRSCSGCGTSLNMLYLNSR